MKKHTIYKTIQLIILIALSALVIYRIFLSPEIYHQVANDPTMKLISGVVWAVLGLSFLFVFLDFVYFFRYRKEYHEMEIAAHSDPESGIANRFSCDMVIEQYLDKPLPSNIGCMMYELKNIQEINNIHGHVQGNATIRDFSNILRLSSEGLCFVGRNSGNKFLAIFENDSKDAMDSFEQRVENRVSNRNKDSENIPIDYAFGKAYSGTDNVKDITKLIALSDRRINDPQL